MLSVQDIAYDIVAREGGFVNDPDDPGGATNFGVTIGTMKRLGIDLDGDGDVDIDDVKLLTADKAAEIFINEYYYKPKFDRLPIVIQATVFDMYVNAGGNAIKILQELVNHEGFGPVSVDGAIGPDTLHAVKLACSVQGMPFVDKYGCARREYYYRIADRNAKLRKFARRQDGGKGGWIKRAEEFISPELHLTDSQHRERTRHW